MSRNLGRALILCTVLSLAAQAAWAGPARADVSSSSAWGLLMQLWNAFTAASWSDEGCWLDPNGGCDAAEAPAPEPPSQIDVGCWIDPNGGCRAAQALAPPAQKEVGCIIDPNGGCRGGG